MIKNVKSNKCNYCGLAVEEDGLEIVESFRVKTTSGAYVVDYTGKWFCNQYCFMDKFVRDYENKDSEK